MLFAIDKDNKKIQATIYTDEKETYHCPICKNRVILKKGKKNTPHFSHLSQAQCLYSKYYKEKAISSRHKEMVSATLKYFKSYKCIKEIFLEESIIENKISDLVIKFKNDISIIVECENKEIDIKNYKETTRQYNEKGYAVIWIFDEKIKDSINQLASCYISKNNRLFSLKKVKEENSNKKVDKREYFRIKDCLYMNKRTITTEENTIIRIGIGVIKEKKDWIAMYGLSPNDIIEFYNAENKKIKNKKV